MDLSFRYIPKTIFVYVLQNLGITHEEKLATYLRYLKEAPSYCHDNAWCYSFFNLGGCNNEVLVMEDIQRTYKGTKLPVYILFITVLKMSFFRVYFGKKRIPERQITHQISFLYKVHLQS